ncbi:MAG: large conductance mechanosensitive channel protein MscL [Alphaproteobacteria bacterium]|nr:large conductance mechanosensitive channel protein MscL [Alphaproteobacteria bacterium]
MLNDFKAFIARGNVVDLAVGIIVGAAFTGIVTSLVGDILMPVLGALTGGLDFSNHFIALTGHYDTLQEARAAGAPVIAYGLFLNHVINFLIVSFAIFLLVRQLQRFYRTQAPAPTTSEKLLAEIRDLLKQR